MQVNYISSQCKDVITCKFLSDRTNDTNCAAQSSWTEHLHELPIIKCGPKPPERPKYSQHLETENCQTQRQGFPQTLVGSQMKLLVAKHHSISGLTDLSSK